MSDVLHWTTCVYQSIPWPESHDAVVVLGQVGGAPDAVRSAWVLGRNQAVRSAVLALLEGTEFGVRVVAAVERMKARCESAVVEDL